MSDIPLQRFFEFDEGDLHANRNGRLSPKQQKKIDEGERGAKNILVGAGVVFILIALGVSYGVLSSALGRGLSFSHITTDDIIGLGLGVGLPWLFLGLLAFGSFRMAFSKLDMSVQKVEGKVNFVKVEKRESYKTAGGSDSYRTVEEYELRVGKVNFEDVDEELLNIIEEGDTYAFYYTKDAKNILSAEFVAKGK
ncbi:MAG: hypothetical protein AB1554_04160 [Chloroflexota bacterium]